MSHRLSGDLFITVCPKSGNILTRVSSPKAGVPKMEYFFKFRDFIDNFNFESKWEITYIENSNILKMY